MATEIRARRAALAAMTAAEIAQLRWRLADAAFQRGDLVAAREHALAATPAPRRRPRQAERTPKPYTIAIAARRDREIAERVEHWRASLGSDRRAAERAVRAMAAAQRKQLPRGVLGDPGTPAEIAARIVAWEMTRPDDPLTPAAVRRRATRARKSST
jgi:hypothetical protein